MNRSVLVVAAHPDDEALGCGGTIARHVAEGDAVHVVFLSDGVSAREGADAAALARRMAATDEAMQILGVRKKFLLGLPDNRLDSLPLLDVIQPLERLIDVLKPEMVYTHHHGDLNVDHRIANKAVLTACRPMPGCSVKEIYAFEVVSSTEWNSPSYDVFAPQRYVDVSEYWDVKIAALKAYESEMREAPHARCLENVKALAIHRGCSVGIGAAEAFMVIRIMS